MNLFNPQSRISLFFCLLLALPAVLPVLAQQEEALPATEAPGIAIVPRDGFNLGVSELISPSNVVLNIESQAHNWFAGSFINLPIGQQITFGISLAGKDTTEPANVAKWQGLRPFLTFADPTLYDSYIGYTKGTNGHWIADDLFRAGDQDAGAGPLPEQTVIPANLAEQFLSPDGNSWYPWREIDPVQVLTNVNICRFTATFEQSSASIAMRVPYTYTYQQAFLQRLRAANLPGVFLDEIGTTPDGRTLTVIRLEPPDLNNAPTTRPSILAYAREHATEPDGSWAIEGILRWLLSDDPTARMARRQNDWLLVPIFDPDMSARAVFTNANLFRNIKPVRPEAVEYAKYLVNRTDAGHRLEIVINLHSVECSDGPNLFSPLVNRMRANEIKELDRELWQTAQNAGFATCQPDWGMTGLATSRLCGWCYKVFRTMDLSYEVNGRAPDSRLTTAQLMLLGRFIAQHGATIIQGTKMVAIREEIKQYLIEREKERAAWWQQQKRDANTRTNGDLLVQGF